MLPKALGKFNPRTSESRRIPLEREISFRVPRFENFVTEYSANISATGIFVRTREPLEPGTELSLEFKVADDWKLIRGRGRVIWVRHKDEGENAPAGMGIRFLEMDPQSRRLIHWMVDKHAREGGETFEFEELRQTADQALGSALGGTEELVVSRGSGRSIGADRAAFARRLALVIVALGLLGLLSWVFLQLAPPIPSAEEIARQPAEAPAEGAGNPAGETPDVPAAVLGTVSPSSGARELVDSWADAWSEGRVEDYLSFYSQDFQPDDGSSRRQWRASRVERLSAPQYIRVSITALDLQVQDSDRVRATFFQNYRSERFEDTVRKSLDLALESDGRWRILRERVVG